MLQIDLFESCMYLVRMANLDFRKRTKWTRVQATYSIAFLTFQMVFTFMLLTNWQGTDTLNALTQTVPTLLQTMVKVLAIMYHHEKLRKMSVTLANFWPWDTFGPQLKSDLHDIHRYLKRTYQLFAVFNSGTLILFAVKPLLMRVKMLPVLRYNWCNEDGFVCYATLYLFQVEEFIYVFVINVGFDGLFMGLMAYSYCEFEKIKRGFNRYEARNKKNPKSFAELIDHHNLVLSFVQDLGEVFTFVLLCQFGSTIATICIEVLVVKMEGYPPHLGRVSSGAAFMFSYLFELGIYCVGGTKIIEQAESVAESIYDSDWTSFDNDLRKAVVLVVQRSCRPVPLKIGEMLVLNLETFTSVINFSISFATLMQRVF